MATLPETVTYILIFNESDLVRLDSLGHRPTHYVHGLTDIVFLAMLVIISFLCNAVVVMAVASQPYLRKQPFYALLMILSNVFLVDCAFNGFLSLAYMSRIVWPLGSSMCVANVFVIQVVLAVVPWLLLQVAIDRYVCLRHPMVYRQWFTVSWQMASTGAILILSVLASLPYLTGFLLVREFPARMACGAANIAVNQYAYIYIAVLLSLQTITPSMAVLVFGFFFARALISNRRERQRLQVRSWLRPEAMSMSSAAKTTMSPHDTTTVCVWLVASGCYVAAILPYTVLGAVHQMSQSPEEDDAGYQEVCRTPNTDVFLTWLRYLATWLHPLAVLSLLDDVRQEALALLTSWRTSSVSPDPDDRPAISHGSGRSMWKIFGTKHRDDGNSLVQADALTAVLFPSPNGLFLRHPIGRSTSQFDYAVCDTFSECCFREKKLLPDEWKGGSVVHVIGKREYAAKQLKVVRKLRSRQPRDSTSKTLKLSNTRNLLKNVDVRQKPRKNVYKTGLRKLSNPNASAIISAEPINPFKNL